MKRTLPLLAAAVLLAASVIPALAADEMKNLQVLPKDMGKREVIDVMKGFTAALGVRCDECHVQTTPGDFDSFDFASDDKGMKRTARGMMRMVGEINGDLLGKAGVRGHEVSCVTCHRGLTDPATLAEVLERTTAKEGVDAAVARYRELREKYLGSGSYDFSARTLADAAETRATKDGDLDGALAFCDLNVEVHADDVMAWLTRASIRNSLGDTEAARTDVLEALKLEPDNGYAKRMLSQLGG